MKRVVIIGGGFCGALTAKLLDNDKDLSITLLDKKNYFEYTPSIHKILCDSTYVSRLRIPFSHFLKKTTILTTPIVQITPIVVVTTKEKLPYDVLIVTTGIDYPVRLKNAKNTYVVSKGDRCLEIAKKIPNAQQILVVGGGLVGVEVAAELVTKTKGKRVVVVHPMQRLLERNPESSSKSALKFLEKHGAQVIFGERVAKQDGLVFVTDKGRRINADLAFWCAGVQYNPSFMKGFPQSIFTERNALKVNEYLQLDGFSNIFVGGDITSVVEEKTAHNAERHAKVIAKNVRRLIARRELVKYSPHASPLLISLGDRASIFSWKNFSWTGRIPALLKRAVEWFVLRKYR